MIVSHDPAEIPEGFGPSVVAIGKFDGVHSGHRAVIAGTVDDRALERFVAAAARLRRHLSDCSFSG